MDLHVISLAALGGAMIGLAAALMLFFTGRIAGISGISKGLLAPKPGDWQWRLAFVLGLVAGGALVCLSRPEAFRIATGRPLWAVAVAGLLVGYGSVLANGCTSGHGVCGVSRLSIRSMVATLTFMLAGFATVAAWNLAHA